MDLFDLFDAVIVVVEHQRVMTDGHMLQSLPFEGVAARIGRFVPEANEHMTSELADAPSPTTLTCLRDEQRVLPLLVANPNSSLSLLDLYSSG